MKYLACLIVLCAGASNAAACPQALFGYGYTQAYYAASQQIVYQQQTQQYAASSVEAEIAALELRIAQLRASFRAQYTQQQTAYYSAPLAVVEQPVYVQRFAVRRRAVLAVEAVDVRRPVAAALGFVGRVLDAVAPRRVVAPRQIRQFRRH